MKGSHYLKANKKRYWLLFMIVLLCGSLALLVVFDYLRPHSRPAEDAVPPAPVPARTRQSPAARPPAETYAASSVSGRITDPERNIINIFKRASPSVVSVANSAIVQDYFGFQVYEIPRGVGSGIVWDKAGHILCNFHLVFEASAIKVVLRNGDAYNARVTGVDPDHDLAVLKIDAPPAVLEPIAVGTSGDLEVGQTVLAIGNPFGLDTSLSVGVVSALGRSMETMSGRRVYDMIQTDAAINPGNSGGPLLDSAGRLVGVNTAILSPSGAYAGIGFAVPVDTVRRIVPQLITQGKIARAGLGIQLVPDHITAQAGITGAAILKVLPRGAAAKTGLRGIQRMQVGDFEFGDVIVAIDGGPVRNCDDYFAIVDRHRGGDLVKVTVRRAGVNVIVETILQDVD